MSTTQKDLERMCDNIAEELKNVYNGIELEDEDEADMYGLEVGDTLSFYDYFNDALDIEYTIGGDGTFRGVRIMVACGGSNIWVDTLRGEVFGAWWSDRASAWIPSEICNEIDEVFEEYYNCTR